jgi:hypothetical protein
MEAIHSPSKAKPSKYEYEYVNQEEPLTTAIIEALARVENVDPVDLEVSLYDAVDPDLIDALGQTIATSSGGDPDWWYQFTLDPYTVEISSDGTISVHTSTPEQGTPTA